MSKHDDIKLIVATDIFGETAAFNFMLDELGRREQFHVVSPYPQSCIHFNDEAQAYRCFQKQGGLDAYSLKLAQKLVIHKNVECLLGFSAGGAAMYQAIANSSYTNHQRVMLFYPGQIRHMLSLQLETPCHIIFPCEEEHFDLVQVINVLNTKDHLSLEQTKYHHGFMNVLSKNFNQQAYQEYCHYLRKFLV